MSHTPEFELYAAAEKALREGLDDVAGKIAQVIEQDIWRCYTLPNDEIVEHHSFAAFVAVPPPYGLGADVETIRRVCRDTAYALDLVNWTLQQAKGARKYNKRLDNVDKKQGPVPRTITDARREKYIAQVWAMSLRGATNSKIATELKLSAPTVGRYLKVGLQRAQEQNAKDMSAHLATFCAEQDAIMDECSDRLARAKDTSLNVGSILSVKAQASKAKATALGVFITRADITSNGQSLAWTDLVRQIEDEDAAAAAATPTDTPTATPEAATRADG